MARIDDGSREAAVRERGEDTARAAEGAQLRPALIPPGVRPGRVDERGSHSAGLSSPGPGVGQ